MSRRLFVYLTLGSLAAIIVLTRNPLHDKIHQLGLLAGIAGLWIGCLLLSWKHRPIRFVLFTLAALCAAAFLLLGRPVDREKLRADYLAHMLEMQGVRYFWGGENARGIDCSGLPRKALRTSLLSQALHEYNGRALRLFAEQWWYDSSAKALSEGYRDYAVPAGVSGVIETMDYSRLQPGDLAITDNGVHVMIYVGKDQWIQADPGKGRVAVSNGRTEDNVWFKAPVSVYRWKVLSGG